MGITPLRRPVDKIMTEAAAELVEKLLDENYPNDKSYSSSRDKALVNIGVGLPEEVSSILYNREIANRLTFTTNYNIIFLGRKFT